MALGSRENAYCKDLKGSHARNLLPYGSIDCYRGHVLVEGVSVSLRSLQAAWPHKRNVKAAMPLSIVAKLSTKMAT